MRGVGLSWAKTACRSQPLEKSPAVRGEHRQEAGGWAGFCWGSEIGQHCASTRWCSWQRREMPLGGLPAW